MIEVEYYLDSSGQIKISPTEKKKKKRIQIYLSVSLRVSCCPYSFVIVLKENSGSSLFDYQ